ncbi:hypothetical protein [Paraburkholderia youngii]|uniref:hypothetical protein n=1 Tax=Paraburkholderia youngii TaxID=2782701 RepID=UPI003D1AA883
MKKKLIFNASSARKTMNPVSDLRIRMSRHVCLAAMLISFGLPGARAETPSSSSMVESFDNASAALLEDSKTLLAMASVMSGNEQEFAMDLEDISQQLSDIAGNSVNLINIADAGDCGVSLNQRRIISRQFGYDAKTVDNLQKRIILAQSQIRTHAFRDAAATLAQHAEKTQQLLRTAGNAYAIR